MKRRGLLLRWRGLRREKQEFRGSGQKINLFHIIYKVIFKKRLK